MLFKKQKRPLRALRLKLLQAEPGGARKLDLCRLLEISEFLRYSLHPKSGFQTLDKLGLGPQGFTALFAEEQMLFNGIRTSLIQNT